MVKNHKKTVIDYLKKNLYIKTISQEKEFLKIPFFQEVFSKKKEN